MNGHIVLCAAPRRRLACWLCQRLSQPSVFSETMVRLIDGAASSIDPDTKLMVDGNIELWICDVTCLKWARPVSIKGEELFGQDVLLDASCLLSSCGFGPLSLKPLKKEKVAFSSAGRASGQQRGCRSVLTWRGMFGT